MRCLIVAITLAGVLLAGSSQAHQQEIGTILVVDHHVEPGKAGGDTIARLRVENLGTSTRQVMGLHTDVASSSVIEIRVAADRVLPISSLPVPAGEILDLANAAWIRLISLRRDLAFGETIEAELDLADGRHKRVTLTVGMFEH